MAFASHLIGFEAQQPRQVQLQCPPIFQQPIIPMPSPHFLLMPQVQVHHPVAMMTMMAHPPPLLIMAPLPSPSSILPPGAASFPMNPPRGITLRIVFHGHASDDYTPPLCVSSATYRDSLPSRDALLAGMATWAGHHGISIQHAGGRIDPLKAKLYVMPKGSPGGGLAGIDVVPGVGLVVPGDVVKVVRLGGIEERDWEEALREIKREGYEAVVVVDMTAPDTASTPTVAGGDQAAAAAAT
ncbi:hypothetical protein ACHAQJ_004930 [Trichoderma viride]